MASTTDTLYLGVAVALLVIYGSLLLWRRQSKLYGNLPPGPRPLPILGSLHLLGTRPHRNLAELASQYGPLMSVWLGQRLCIVASTAEAAKEFLKLQDANFAFRPSIRAAEIVLTAGQCPRRKALREKKARRGGSFFHAMPDDEDIARRKQLSRNRQKTSDDNDITDEESVIPDYVSLSDFTDITAENSPRK